MTNKIKMISINAFEKAIDKTYEPTTTVNWNGLDIVIKKHLCLAEVAKFVDTCCKACFDAETHEYAPEAKDFAIRSCVMSFYTNITMPTNLERQYELIYHSMIMDVITPNIDNAQFKAIINAVEDKIAYHAELNEKLVQQQIESFQNTVKKFEKQMAEMFNGIKIDDMKNIMGALSNNKLDEEKLVEAYMKNKRETE